MKELKKRIDEILSSSPPLMAKEIASNLSVHKSTINKILYAFMDTDYLQLEGYRWTLIRQTGDFEDLLSHMDGHKTAKKFTVAQFKDSMRFSNINSAPTEKYIAFFDEYPIYFDSKLELKMFDYLVENVPMKCCVSQAFEITYSHYGATKKRTYIPDITFLSESGYICVLEVKPTNQMVLDGNMVKYEALESYCQKHGYLYAMIDPENDFRTLLDLGNIEVNPFLEDLFMGWMVSDDQEIDYYLAMAIIHDIITKHGGETKTGLTRDLAILVAWFCKGVGVKGGNALHFMAPEHVIYKKPTFEQLHII